MNATARPTVLLCSRVDDIADSISGSTQVPCDGCGAAVWVSPSSQQFIAEGLRPVCSECLVERLKRGAR